MSILAFVVTVLLIPALIYIWSNNRKEMSEMKTSIEKHQADNVEQRRRIKKDVEDCKLNGEKIKNNYLERFADLSEQISKEFKVERAANVKQYMKLNNVIGDMNITMTAIAGKLSNLKLNKGV